MYLVRTAEGAYEAGGWFDAGWWAGLAADRRRRLAAPRPTRRAPPRRTKPAPDRRAARAPAPSASSCSSTARSRASTRSPSALAAAVAGLRDGPRSTLTFRQNVAMLRASRDEALTDALTGLGNRRALDARARRALPRRPPRPARARAVRPRRLQALQRHLRPPRRRRPARPPGRATCAAFLRRPRPRLPHGRRRVLRAVRARRATTAEPIVEGAALALSEHGEGFWIGCSTARSRCPSEATDAAEALRIADQRMYAQQARRPHVRRAARPRTCCCARWPSATPTWAGTRRRRRARRGAPPAGSGSRRDELERVRHAAELHDVGKVADPRRDPRQARPARPRRSGASCAATR